MGVGTAHVAPSSALRERAKTRSHPLAYRVCAASSSSRYIELTPLRHGGWEAPIVSGNSIKQTASSFLSYESWYVAKLGVHRWTTMLVEADTAGGRLRICIGHADRWCIRKTSPKVPTCVVLKSALKPAAGGEPSFVHKEGHRRLKPPEWTSIVVRTY